MPFIKPSFLCCASAAALVFLAACSDVAEHHEATAAAATASANNFGGSGVMLKTVAVDAMVLLQNDAESNTKNRDGVLPLKSNGVERNYSIGAYVDPNDEHRVKFFVNDRGNHRILIFNALPTDADAKADVVVGQTGFAQSGLAPASATTLNDNVHLSVCANGTMLVADRGNNRVLGFHKVPTSHGAAADFVIGQPDFTTTAQVAPPTARSLFRPYAAYCMADKLLVVDKDNHRIQVFDLIPTGSHPAASYTIGQPDASSREPGCADNKLFHPYEVLRVGEAFLVADGGNHRVLAFDKMPETHGAKADAVLGQPDMNSCLQNQGRATPDAKTLAWPNALASDGKRLAISDHTNNRVVIHRLPVTTHAQASAQMGQPDFNTATLISPPTATSLSSPKGILYDQHRLWVGDTNNHRVVVLPLPAHDEGVGERAACVDLTRSPAQQRHLPGYSQMYR
jgi:hypothetical protein